MTPPDQPLTRADFDAVDWQAVIASETKKTTFNYWLAFSNKHREAEAAKEERKARVFSILAVVMGMELTPDDANEPLSPPFVVTGARGPDVRDLSDEEVGVLAEIAERAHDAEARARICDVVWIRKRRFQLVQKAVESYLASADALYDPEHWIDCELRYRRAANLARSLGRGGEKLFPLAVKAVEDRLAALDGDDGFGLSCRLMELLQEVVGGDAKKYAAMAEKGARKAEAEGGFAFDRARRYWLCAADWYQIARDIPGKQAALSAAAEAFEKQATEALAKPKGNLTAANHLRSAVDALRKVGTPAAVERADALYKRLVDAQRHSVGEMIRSVRTVDISARVEQVRKEVAGLTVPDALWWIARHAAPPPLKWLRERVEDRLRQVPLEALLLNSTRLSSTGKIMAGTPHRDSSVTGREYAILAQMHSEVRNIQAIHAADTLAPAIDTIRFEHHIRLRDFVAFAEQSSFVPAGHELDLCSFRATSAVAWRAHP